MRFPAHVKAFYASWIRRLVEPREASWKDIAQHWLPFPRGHLLSVLSPTEKNNPKLHPIAGTLPLEKL